MGAGARGGGSRRRGGAAGYVSCPYRQELVISAVSYCNLLLRQRPSAHHHHLMFAPLLLVLPSSCRLPCCRYSRWAARQLLMTD